MTLIWSPYWKVNPHESYMDLTDLHIVFPDNKVDGASMGPTWGRQVPGGPHVGHMNLAIRDMRELFGLGSVSNQRAPLRIDHCYNIWDNGYTNYTNIALLTVCGIFSHFTYYSSIVIRILCDCAFFAATFWYKSPWHNLARDMTQLSSMSKICNVTIVSNGITTERIFHWINSLTPGRFEQNFR